MAPERRGFERKVGQRRYRKLFVIAVEGEKTEPQYFSVLGNLQSVIQVKCLTGHRSNSPRKVLKRMEEYLKGQQLRLSDEA